MPRQVQLNSEIGFDQFVTDDKANGIIDSRTFKGGEWKKLTRQQNFPANISKNIIPVDIGYANFVVVTTAQPGTKAARHSHDEPQLRYVISGGFTLNDQHYGPGEWVFVPTGLEYEMESDTGYVTLGCYGVACTGPPT